MNHIRNIYRLRDIKGNRGIVSAYTDPFARINMGEEVIFKKGNYEKDEEGRIWVPNENIKRVKCNCKGYPIKK